MKKEKWTLDNVSDLSGQIFIVTGANSGIGYEAAKVFASKNATVVMGCRSLDRAQKAKNDILEEFPNSILDIISLDLSDFQSIKSFANSVKEKYSKIDVLLNNAGIMTLPYGPTKDGLELQIGVNHFGHFYLTMNLISLINKTKNSRIVNVASIAHKFGNLKPSKFVYNEKNRYSKYFAYAQSKLANLLFTFGLDDRLKELNSNVKVLAAHPGITHTNLGRHLNTKRTRPIHFMIGTVEHPQSIGAYPSIRACTDQLAASGDYFGPDGFFEIKGSPTKVKTTRRAKSKKLQNILWDKSVELTNQTLKL